MTDHLLRQMKSWVVRGLIQPGERLPPERELATAMNVSRALLRQALKVLQAMGVLEVRQGSGNYLNENAVRILQQPSDLLMPLRGLTFAELFETRRAMEAEAAASAAARASDADLACVRRELEHMRTHLREPVAYVRHDVLFHKHIASASGNGVFVWFLELASKVMGDAWLARAKEGHSDRTFAEHQRILEAIEGRGAEAARETMLQHLTLTKFCSTQQMRVELRVISKAHPV